MKKNTKIVLILVFAVLVAVIGGVALYSYLTPRKTSIYVFKQNVAAGTVVTEDMLMVVQADSSLYTAGAKGDISKYYVTAQNLDAVINSGDSLRMDVVQGMPFALSLLTANGGSKVEMNMDPTKIAVTIPVNMVTGVTNDLKEGSRVNVYVTGSGINGDESYVTMLLFESMRVLYIGRNSSGELSTVTLETDREQSMELVHYATTYSIYLGLVDSSGYEYAPEKQPIFNPGGSKTP